TGALKVFASYTHKASSKFNGAGKLLVNATLRRTWEGEALLEGAGDLLAVSTKLTQASPLLAGAGALQVLVLERAQASAILDGSGSFKLIGFQLAAAALL